MHAIHLNVDRFDSTGAGALATLSDSGDPDVLF